MSAADLPALIAEGLNPAMALLPVRMDSPRARLWLIACMLQESRGVYRDQVDAPGTDVLGPALGLLQFERGGGVRAVLQDARTSLFAEQVCEARGVQATPDAAWRALKTDDVLAFAFGRLFLHQHPDPLPPVEDVTGAFKVYVEQWRPGAYWRGSDNQRAQLAEKWRGNHVAARAALGV